jgi:hypothetical protein
MKMIIPTRNRIKQIYPNIKEGKVYHNSINTPSLINISIRNKKIAESLSPSRKMMNKTTSESFSQNKKGVRKQKYFKKIKKNDNFKKKKNYCNSSVELNNRKRYQILHQKKNIIIIQKKQVEMSIKILLLKILNYPKKFLIILIKYMKLF